MRVWVKSRLTGCTFASTMLRQKEGQRGGITILEQSFNRDRLATSTISSSLELLAFGRSFGIIFFPDINSPFDLANMLALLGHHERWRVTVKSVDEHEIALQVEWRTQEGHWSDCLGLAPMMGMPPTRRAPYVGLALWPGPPRTSNKSGKVDLKDVPSPLPKSQHKGVRDETRERVSALFGERFEKTEWQSLAFKLPAESCGPLLMLLQEP